MRGGHQRHVDHVRAILAAGQAFAKFHRIGHACTDDALHGTRCLRARCEGIPDRIDGNVDDATAVVAQAQAKAVIAVLEFDLDLSRRRPPAQATTEDSRPIARIWLAHKCYDRIRAQAAITL